MPMQKPRSRLLWRGKETVQEILNKLHERERIHLILPAGFHHAVSVRLIGDRGMHNPIGVALDDKGFERLADIKGLRQLSELREPLARAGMTARIRTPPPQILLLPSDSAVGRRTHHSRRPAAVIA